MNNMTNNPKSFPPPYKRRRYYTPDEVKIHNTENDCWVSFFNEVYDLTELVQNNGSYLIDPIVNSAGQDISHWFDESNRDPRECVIEGTSLKGYFCPSGYYLHVPPAFPDAEWDYNFNIPWWKNNKYRIGKLSIKTRKIRIVNVLTKEEHAIDVCQEETINEIQERYKELNEHAESYTWKRLQRVLDMELTLSENDIHDETEEYLALEMDPESYIPAIYLYFNDDLTEA